MANFLTTKRKVTCRPFLARGLALVKAPFLFGHGRFDGVVVHPLADFLHGFFPVRVRVRVRVRASVRVRVRVRPLSDCLHGLFLGFLAPLLRIWGVAVKLVLGLGLGLGALLVAQCKEEVLLVLFEFGVDAVRGDAATRLRVGMERLPSAGEASGSGAGGAVDGLP